MDTQLPKVWLSPVRLDQVIIIRYVGKSFLIDVAQDLFSIDREQEI
jgi:hypothetical protein